MPSLPLPIGSVAITRPVHGIERDELLIAAPSKEAMMRRVDREPARLFARGTGQRPSTLSAWVSNTTTALPSPEVDVHLARPVGGGELGSPPQRHAADYAV